MVEATSGETSGEQEAAAEPSEADKIIIQVKIAKIKINLKTTNLNLTKRVPGMLMGLQIVPAPGTGPQGAARPTAPTPSTVVGPTSSLLVLLNKIIKIDMLAALV